MQALTEPRNRHALLSGGWLQPVPQPVPPALHSHALNQLHHVLDLAAQLLGLQEALLTFTEESQGLGAAQEASPAGPRPPQPLRGHDSQQALLYPCSLAPSLARAWHLGGWESQICKES